MGKKHEVYTYSYLGLGLMAARKAIFTYGQDLSASNPESGVIEVRFDLIRHLPLRDPYRLMTKLVSPT